MPAATFWTADDRDEFPIRAILYRQPLGARIRGRGLSKTWPGFLQGSERTSMAGGIEKKQLTEEIAGPSSPA